MARRRLAVEAETEGLAREVHFEDVRDIPEQPVR